MGDIDGDGRDDIYVAAVGAIITRVCEAAP